MLQLLAPVLQANGKPHTQHVDSTQQVAQPDSLLKCACPVLPQYIPGISAVKGRSDYSVHCKAGAAHCSRLLQADLHQGCRAEDEWFFAGWLAKDALGQEAVEGGDGLERLAEAHAVCVAVSYSDA